MKALTYTSYKVHYDLYAEIEGLIAIKSFQMKLAQKDIILLSKFSIAVFKTAKRTSVENKKYILTT